MKKTLYSLVLNDEVVREVDALAHRMGTNRSNLINQILAEYVNYTTLPLRVQLGTLIKKVQKMVWIVAAGCAVLAAASVLVLLRVTRRDPRMASRSLVFALAGAALVCLVIGLAVNPMMNLQRLSLEPVSLKNLVICYVEGIFSRFTVFASIYFAVSLVLGLLLRPRKQKKKPAE